MDRGYDPKRFVEQVRRDLLCFICLCVLKVPRLCEAGEHYFCCNCISQHLATSSTCPGCQEPLTVETLKLPQSFVLIFLSELRIKCDYIVRGCLEHVQLGNLQNHVNGCEYRPVTCEICGREVNAKDKDGHQKKFCQLGGANIQELGMIMRQEEFDQKENGILDSKVHQNKMGKEFQQKLQRVESVTATNGGKESHDLTNSYVYGTRNEVAGVKRRQDYVCTIDTKIKVTKLLMRPLYTGCLINYLAIDMFRLFKRWGILKEGTRLEGFHQ